MKHYRQFIGGLRELKPEKTASIRPARRFISWSLPMEGGTVAKRIPLSERFWSKVSKGESDECWLWAASCGTGGYGQFSMPGDKIVKSHRIAWILTHGEIEGGLCVLHKCDNPPCCNPAHLFLGTIADNNKDMRQKGRDVGTKLLQRARRLEPWWVEYERRNTPKWKRASLGR